GITVDVQENEIEQLNKYTKETARAIGKKKKEYHLVEEPGIQTLEGVQAVSYGRIRKGVGDDYKRTERMRTVVNLVFQKLKNRSFSKLKEIINIVVPQCRTNLKLNDILALGKDITKYSISSGSGFPYTVGNKTLNGVSYVFPANLGESVMQLHRDVFGQEDYILSDTASAISNEIYRRFISASGSNAVVDINDLEYNQQSSTQSQTTTADQTSANLGTTQQNPSQTQTTTITSTSTSDTTAGESSDSGGSKSDSSKTDSKSDSSKSESSDSGKTDSSKTDSSKSDSGKSESGKSDSGKSDSSKTDSGDSSQTTQPAQVTEPEPEPQPEPEPEPEPEPTPEPEPEPEPTPDPGPSDGGGDSDTSGEG
ncbi:MAG: LCP family protein, partial [Firmicutes bacterium]|nr:LCP family protein [Bacillota bacterium]